MDNSGEAQRWFEYAQSKSKTVLHKSCKFVQKNCFKSPDDAT